MQLPMRRSQTVTWSSFYVSISGATSTCHTVQLAVKFPSHRLCTRCERLC